MSEGDMRGRVVRALRSLDAMAVENKVRPGTPDVEYIGGWVELKWLRRWPKNALFSPVKIEHFTPQQRVWLKKRWRRGGRALLLLQAAGIEWFLFDGETAAQRVGRVTRRELYNCALMHMSPFNQKELIRWLTMDLSDLQLRKASLLFGEEMVKHSVKLLND